MNIAIFIKDFAVGKKFSKNGLPTKSGAEFHGENHALQLIKRGHNVTIMAKKRYWFTKARENINGIDLVRLHAPFRWLEIVIRLLTTHRSVEAFYIIGTPKFAVWMILLARLFNKPVTLALTGKAEIFNAERNWRNRILATCTNYIATTHEIQQGFIAQGHVSPECVSVLAHGIDTNKYPCPTAEEKARLREKHNVPQNVPVLLFCARIVLNKGIDTLLKVWPLVHKENPTAKLLVVGGGRHELMAALRKMAKETDDSVQVLGEVEQPQEFYQLADVYIFPSRHEGLPTSLLEAMSSGLVAVTSDIGGCDDLIFNDKTGYRVNSEDAVQFAEKIIYLFDNQPARQIMQKTSIDLVHKYCDYTYVVEKLEKIIGSKNPVQRDYLKTEEI